MGWLPDFHPLIYDALANGAQLNYFRDPASGSNGAYNCQPGYDMVTGAGVPTFSTLENLALGQ